MRDVDIEEQTGLGFAYRNRQAMPKQRWQFVDWVILYVNAILVNQLPPTAGLHTGRSDTYLADLVKDVTEDPEYPFKKLTCALLRTLSCDRLPSSKHITSQTSQVDSSLHPSQITESPDQDADLNRCFTGYAAWKQTGSSGTTPPDVFEEYEDWAVECGLSRKLVLVRNLLGGHYLALVPAHARVGHEIILLRGASVPFVVSPVVGPDLEIWYRHFVGECFVDGLMDGQWMDIADGAKLWEDFLFG